MDMGPERDVALFYAVGVPLAWFLCAKLVEYCKCCVSYESELVTLAVLSVVAGLAIAWWAQAVVCLGIICQGSPWAGDYARSLLVWCVGPVASVSVFYRYTAKIPKGVSAREAI